MADLVSLITKVGKNNIWATGFYGGSGNVFRYGAAGKGATSPTEESTSLNSECTAGDGSYARVELVNTFETVNKRIKAEMTFPTTNITNSTTIKEIAIFDATTSGIPFCICQIPDTVKDNTKQLKFTVLGTFA